jgi:D-alanyl-D-alanine-carboxypeptidase/D-alanyl-D-alanine-endopeptidase
VISYGRFGHDDARPVDGETLFEIGSVTKVFTALLLADMVRRGEVALSDPVSKYLPPGITLAAPDGRSITLEDLATHTAGLPFWPSGIPATGEGLRLLARYRDDQLYAFLRTFEVPPEAGTRWAYSNTDAGLLGLALARRAHSSYEALLAGRVTGPLNMKSTSVTPAPAMRARLSVGHDKQLAAAPPWDVPALAAAGSLHSTANDLLTFLSAAMGLVSSPLSPAMAAMLATRRAAPAFQQALGWWIFTEGNDQLITHVGGTLGFASQVSYQPRTQTGIVVLSNSVNAVSDLTRQLLRPASGTAAVPVAAATVR